MGSGGRNRDRRCCLRGRSPQAPSCTCASVGPRVHTLACSNAASSRRASHPRPPLLGEQGRSLCGGFARRGPPLQGEGERHARVSSSSFSWSFPPITALFCSPLPPASVDTAHCQTGVRMCLLKSRFLPEASSMGTGDRDQLSPWERISLLDPQCREVVSKSPADPEWGGGVDSSLSLSCCWSGAFRAAGRPAQAPCGIQATAFPPCFPGGRVGLDLMKELWLQPEYSAEHGAWFGGGCLHNPFKPTRARAGPPVSPQQWQKPRHGTQISRSSMTTRRPLTVADPSRRLRRDFWPT